MKKKLIPLLAGALSAALLLSACGGRTEPTPEPAVPPAPSQEARPTAAVTSLPETPPPGPTTDAPSEPAPESTPAPTAPAETAKPTPTPAQAGTPKPEPTQAPAVNTPAPTPEPTREPPAVTKQAAMAYIGQSAASLAAALGQPLSKDYAPSCMGSGEDGEWSYPGFTVYTYREGGSETVVDVI